MATTYQYIVNILAKNQQFLQAMQQNVGKINDVDKKINQAQQSANKAIGSFTNMANSIGIAFSIGAIASFTGQLIKLSGEAEGVRNAFDRIGNVSDLQRLKDSVHGTVSELELMKRAVTASNFGIPVKELGNLFQFATKRAQDTGQSVDYLVDSIVTGIGRKSPLILDNLGISAVQLKEKLGGIGLEMASVGDVSRAVGEIAAESMKKTGDIIDTNAIKIQALKAHWEDFKLSIAEDKVFNQVFSTVLTELEDMFNIITKLQTTEQVKKQAEQMKFLAAMQADFSKEQESSIDGAKVYSKVTESVSDRLKSLNDQLQLAIKNSKNTSNVELFLQGQKDVEKLKKEIQQLNEYLGSVKPRDTKSYNKIETKQIKSVSLSEEKQEKYEADIDTSSLNDMSDFLKDNQEYVDSLATSWISFGEQYNQVIENMMAGGEDITTMTVAAGEFINNMMAYAESGTASLKGFASAAREAAMQAINTYIAEGVAGAISTALAKSGIPFPLNMVAGAVAAAAATSLFNSLIPSFETGGLVPGTSFTGDKTLIRVNSGEEILTRNDPRHTLNGQRGYIGGGSVINNITFSQKGLELSGRKLRILLAKEERRSKYLGH
ncbi:MAG: hypothetical protein WCY82_01665 [Desulfotomaculaceae bacterium]